MKRSASSLIGRPPRKGNLLSELRCFRASKETALDVAHLRCVLLASIAPGIALDDIAVQGALSALRAAENSGAADHDGVIDLDAEDEDVVGKEVVEALENRKDEMGRALTKKIEEGYGEGLRQRTAPGGFGDGLKSAGGVGAADTFLLSYITGVTRDYSFTVADVTVNVPAKLVVIQKYVYCDRRSQQWKTFLVCPLRDQKGFPINLF